MSRHVAQPVDRALSAAAEADRLRRRKLGLSLEAIHPFVSVEQPASLDDPMPLVAIQLTTRCNQRCPFCQAPDREAMEDPSDAVLRRAFDRVATALPGAKVILTGGEPCLRSDLSALVMRLLADARVGQVEVQTNATLIGQHPARVGFPTSPRLLFVVGMHGLSDEVYDASTATRSLLKRALDGVLALLAAGHPVEFNCVATHLNIDHLLDYVGRIPVLFPGPERPRLHVSIMGVPEHRDANGLLVPFRRLLPAIARSRAEADGLQVDMRVSLSAGHAAVPACMLDPDAPLDHQAPTEYQHEGPLGAEADRWWVQGPECRTCLLAGTCLGLPRSYAERFGFDELESLTAEQP